MMKIWINDVVDLISSSCPLLCHDVVSVAVVVAAAVSSFDVALMILFCHCSQCRHDIDSW